MGKDKCLRLTLSTIVDKPKREKEKVTEVAGLVLEEEEYASSHMTNAVGSSEQESKDHEAPVDIFRPHSLPLFLFRFSHSKPYVDVWWVVVVGAVLMLMVVVSGAGGCLWLLWCWG